MQHDFLDLCTLRYSCRAYKPQPVSIEDITYIVNCAISAPSACNLQPWRVRAVTNTEVLSKLHEAYNRDWFATAGTVFVVSALPGKAWTRKTDGKNHSDIDAAILTEHICLAAASLGLGSCWICNFDPAIVKPALGMDDDEIPVAMVPVGVPADTPKDKVRNFDVLYI